ncbi:DNA adenine methylase [Clostridium sp. LQ25]|uniref:DNA adenine methylase n=1 Tax=Clostridium sp. LQ25 TaxID=2992805 RepID=UPI00224FA5AF|nr:DNA adenine methylase [Clostridium sp. LQ25]MDU5722163.1 DNA adenine methylase [Clostridium butyricum]MDU5820384.1 DNA adenine methylase [Clostridium butyricum]UZT06118.1 DNA adenine methylase [Clostridium sp. LQ25]
MSWIGGKKSLRELIVSLFPLYYERYIEVFGGGGWVLFHKPPGNDFEVYNDFNGLLTNLYRCVREKPNELIDALCFVLNSREDFDIVKEALARDSPTSDVIRASYFYQLIRYSYASGLTSFGSQPHDMWGNFPLIEQAHRRLSKVVVENKDFEKLIRQYDRPVSFFYADPPYFETEKYYKNVGEDGFKKEDHIRLRDTLMGIEGKFLLSYNDCSFIRELYDAPNIQIESYTRINNIKQRYDNGAQFPEILVANYDMHEREINSPSQINLFEMKNGIGKQEGIYNEND